MQWKRMIYFQSIVFHSGIRFQCGDEKGVRSASIPAFDQIPTKEVGKGHRRGKSSGDQRSLERVELGIPHEEREDGGASQHSQRTIECVHPSHPTQITPCIEPMNYLAPINLEEISPSSVLHTIVSKESESSWTRSRSESSQLNGSGLQSTPFENISQSALKQTMGIPNIWLSQTTKQKKMENNLKMPVFHGYGIENLDQNLFYVRQYGL